MNPNYRGYAQYGGRGIKVCEEWAESFSAYRDWCYANGYDDTKTIDRIDNNGNYEPGNCRWATMKEQQRNTRRNHSIEYKGKIYRTQTELAEHLGIKPVTLKARIRKGIKIDAPLWEHPGYQRKSKNGKIYNVKGWTGVKHGAAE